MLGARRNTARRAAPATKSLKPSQGSTKAELKARLFHFSALLEGFILKQHIRGPLSEAPLLPSKAWLDLGVNELERTGEMYFSNA